MLKQISNICIIRIVRHRHSNQIEQKLTEKNGNTGNYQASYLTLYFSRLLIDVDEKENKIEFATN